MSLEMCVLGSGSAGNSTLVRCPAGAFLIDAGLGPRTTAARLAGMGITVGQIAAICLTHLDHDHFNCNWVATICKLGIRVFCHADRADQLYKKVKSWADASPVVKRSWELPSFEKLICVFTDVAFEPAPGICVESIKFSHDSTGSHGFVLQSGACRAGYATDLGHVPDELIERFAALDFLALESNYDREMELESSRPWYLKERIMGGAGHLSNEQAFTAIRKILSRAEQAAARLPEHIVLLHRSRECNCPRLLRKLFETDYRIKSRLVLAEQHESTGWLRLKREMPFVGRQMAMFG